MRDQRTFFQLITDAIKDMEEHGYDSQERVEYWANAIREKLAEITPSIGRTTEQMDERMKAEFERIVNRGGIDKLHPGIPAFTIDRLKPALRAALDRSILANASLIKLNRKKSQEATLQRFVGWATSIPIGGSDINDRKATKEQIRKPLAQLPFEERRVAIDQGHKLAASIHEIVASGSNAIAAEWHSRWRQRGYNYRVDHKERDNLVYLIRGSWADLAGFLKPVNRYTDQITKPAEEVFCQCQYRYLYGLRNLPPDMLTEKGKAELVRVRALSNSILGRTPQYAS